MKMMHFTGTLTQVDVVAQNIREYERRLRVNNSKDRRRKVLPPDQIKRNMNNISENSDLIGQYNLRTNNCEDFANYIRYGIKESDQISYYLSYKSDVLFHLLMVGFILAIVVIVIMAYLLYIYSHSA